MAESVSQRTTHPYSTFLERRLAYRLQEQEFRRAHQTEADKNDPTLRFLVQEFSSSFFKTTKQPLQIGIDLKATKEITGELRMSFYVNRLMFCSPLYYSNLNTPLKIRRTPYFGIEIEIKL